MNLEPILQCGVSKKEKSKYHILMHIYMESRKMIPTHLFSGQYYGGKHKEQTCGHSEGRRGWDELRK